MLKVRAQMEAAGKSAEDLDKQFAELQEPEVNQAGKYVLMMFFELNNARQQGMNGPLPISYTELKAYSDLNDAELEPWEVNAIRLCDRVYIDKVMSAHNKE